MTSFRIRARQPHGASRPAPALQQDPDIVHSVLEDAAHFPGGHAAGVASPRTEAEVAALIGGHARILPIGAQSSLTGGATPMGDVVLNLARMNDVTSIAADMVNVEPGVTLAALQLLLDERALYYPPAPTFNGATLGGTVATNAAGAATFKYGSTRDWVQGLTVVLATGDVVDLVRGEVLAHPDGFFEIELSQGVVRVPVPTYRMPDVPKRSAGYFAAPGMDLVDLFIGAEGTLGVVTAITLKVIRRRSSVCWFLIPCLSERIGLDLVRASRDASRTTWRTHDPNGIDIAAIEHMDRRALELVREEDRMERFGVTLPPDTALALLVQMELPDDIDAARAYADIGIALNAGAADSPIVRFCGLLHSAGVLNQVEVAVPGDRARAEQLFALREAVPAALNRRIGRVKQTVDAGIEKTAADMIVPFDRFDEMMSLYRRGFGKRGLDYAVWGHISDGNVHPNVVPRSMEDVRAGQEAIAEFGREVARLGGCPLAEHGVGRSLVKQRLLRDLYGDRGIDEMRAVKRALDPEGKLARGVIFPDI